MNRYGTPTAYVSLFERIAALEEDPEPADMRPEIAAARALLADLLGRWDRSDGEGTDVKDLLKAIDTIASVIRMQAKNAISMTAVKNLTDNFATEFLAAVREVGIAEPDATRLCECVERRWAALALGSRPAGK